MSAKSAVKVLVPKGDESGLFKWVAVLTGSKNALRAQASLWVGCCSRSFGFRGALGLMASGVLVVLLFVLTALRPAIGQAKKESGVLRHPVEFFWNQPPIPGTPRVVRFA